MTAAGAFELLLKNTEFSGRVFPQLDSDCVDLVASKITRVLYDSLKSRTTSGAEKRLTLLKFVHSLCGANGDHKINLSVFDEGVKCEVLKEDVLLYHKQKKQTLINRSKKVEFVKNWDQKLVDLHFKNPPVLQKNISYYSTSDLLIQSLLGSRVDDCEVGDNRRQLVKVAYSLINLKSHGDVLLKIVGKLKEYDKLEVYEEQLLCYMFKNCFNQKILIENFPLVYEKPLLFSCKKLLMCDTEQSVCDFFMDLQNDITYKLLRDCCVEDIELGFKVKTLLYTLYCYSVCNENLLTFCGFFC